MKSCQLQQIMIAAALALAASAASASVIFHNTGTTGGWSQLLVEHNGSVSQISSPVYKGSTAIKCTQVYDSSYTGRYHSECITNNGYTPGQMRFYGFAFMLPSNWQSVNQGYNISQWEADFNNTGCDDFIPSTMIWITGNQLSTRRKSGTPCSQVTTTYPNIATVSVGVWHRIVVQANWQSDTTGYLKLWFDGTKVLEKFNVATTMADSQNRQFQYRVGLYANGWHDSGSMTGSQGTRTVYFDQIGIGSTFADADPAQW